MATLTIRSIDDDLKQRLRERAAAHGRSMEAEVRAILVDTLSAPPVDRVGTRISDRFRSTGGVDLDLRGRGEAPRAADLDE